jgi:hypothetical protein
MLAPHPITARRAPRTPGPACQTLSPDAAPLRCPTPRPEPPSLFPVPALHVATTPGPRPLPPAASPLHPFKRVLPPPSADFLSPAPCFLLRSDAMPAAPPSPPSLAVGPPRGCRRLVGATLHRNAAAPAAPAASRRRPTSSVSPASAFLARCIRHMTVVL